jgi:hypothetical protein
MMDKNIEQVAVPEQARTFGFGSAIEELKAGRKCWRKGWNGKGIFIELQRPDENSKMSSPYIFTRN